MGVLTNPNHKTRALNMLEMAHNQLKQTSRDITSLPRLVYTKDRDILKQFLKDIEKSQNKLNYLIGRIKTDDGKGYHSFLKPKRKVKKYHK